MERKYKNWVNFNDSNGDKAFCSGGDVSNLYRHGVSETINLENYSGLMSTD